MIVPRLLLESDGNSDQNSSSSISYDREEKTLARDLKSGALITPGAPPCMRSGRAPWGNLPLGPCHYMFYFKVCKAAQVQSWETFNLNRPGSRKWVICLPSYLSPPSLINIIMLKSPHFTSFGRLWGRKLWAQRKTRPCNLPQYVISAKVETRWRSLAKLKIL